jgi:lysophospholipase L1-like esterase
LLPSKRNNDKWNAHHQILVQDVEYAATRKIEHGHELDVVMLGDSITERWNVTRGVGQINNRAVFERFFDKSRNAEALLQGLALGTSGDITTELLWHLKNGMLPDTLQPKVWLILIGTNDLGRSGCSKRTALAGILQVAQYLHTQRPNGTSIILHGLLPRNDVYAPENVQTDFVLNRYWEDILWINRELENFCALHQEWHYMESNDLFLQHIHDHDVISSNSPGAVVINKDMMPDALHPGVAGYEAWAPRIVEQVLKLIQHEQPAPVKVGISEDGNEKMIMNQSDNRCIDLDDPVEWKEIPIKKRCSCPDPLLPRNRNNVNWKAHHQVLVQDVEYAAALKIEHGHELDVVMLGDSITERWNGTRNMGQIDPLFQKDRAVFERFFEKSRNADAPLQGLALGSSGDITTELLWHLQNGMLPDTLQPKVWLILIGTNDLGRPGCSKRTTLAGILQVAQYLHTQRPNGTPIILHGLLPRNIVYASENAQTDVKVNRFWKDILWINRELENFCALHQDLHYMESSELFLQRIGGNGASGGETPGAVTIKKGLMPDALHPNAAGYEAWAPRIVEEVLRLIQKV